MAHNALVQAAVSGNVAGFAFAAQGIQEQKQRHTKLLQAVDAVVQIRTPSVSGTGFIVACQRLGVAAPVVLTNAHVVPDDATARRAEAVAFNDDVHQPHEHHRFRFRRLLYASSPGSWAAGGAASPTELEGHDFAVLEIDAADLARLQRRGVQPLRCLDDAEIARFKRSFDPTLQSVPEVLVVQHPRGGQKKISAPPPKCYKYGGDTVTTIPALRRLLRDDRHREMAIATNNQGAEASQPGSSGSPILDSVTLKVTVRLL